jgi:hypothetical protein
VTCPASEDGIVGAVVFTIASACPGGRTVSKAVPRAAETCAAVPLTGRSELPGLGVPTLRPSLCNTELTRAVSAAEGPNAEAYWSGVR